MRATLALTRWMASAACLDSMRPTHGARNSGDAFASIQAPQHQQISNVDGLARLFPVLSTLAVHYW